MAAFRLIDSDAGQDGGGTYAFSIPDGPTLRVTVEVANDGTGR